ncbi:glycosyltransferase family 4 protein [Luteimicrobium sp. NPDC057192]|uniref:glycosyltransferase family 4 protein n=1 Tax=Luteimicrobium sp. NPDC057192 TaxID=3346042 RepID=UPI00363FD455
MTRRLVHVITPGDHFSPSTGSAVPTVVHGLSAATPPSAPRPAVVVARGTYADRYPSAEVLEYDERLPRRTDRYQDLLAARTVGRRPAAAARFGAALTDQASWDPGIVLVHNAPQGIPVVDDARHVPVLYAHNQLLRTYSRREVARTLGGAARLVCVSDFLARATADRLPPGLRDRVAVVRNGVDTDAFRPPRRWERRDRLEVTFVGRMLHEKGADVLLGALTLLDRGDIHATVVGSAGFDPHAAPTAYETEVARSAAALGDRVTRRPFVPRADVAELLRGADVVVVPSRWPDPCPLTVLEGMASGAALVASTVGGIPEQLGDAGIAVPPDDAAALAEVLGALADDDALLARSRDAARAYALTRTWGRSYDDLASALAGAV